MVRHHCHDPSAVGVAVGIGIGVANFNLLCIFVITEDINLKHETFCLLSKEEPIPLNFYQTTKF